MRSEEIATLILCGMMLVFFLLDSLIEAWRTRGDR